MSKFLALPEVRGIYMLFGKADVLAELEVGKSFVKLPSKRIASLVETKIAGIRRVSQWYTIRLKTPMPNAARDEFNDAKANTGTYPEGDHETLDAGFLCGTNCPENRRITGYSG
jgi:hypothetical protein